MNLKNCPFRQWMLFMHICIWSTRIVVKLLISLREMFCILSTFVVRVLHRSDLVLSQSFSVFNTDRSLGSTFQDFWLSLAMFSKNCCWNIPFLWQRSQVCLTRIYLDILCMSEWHFLKLEASHNSQRINDCICLFYKVPFYNSISDMFYNTNAYCRKQNIVLI